MTSGVDPSSVDAAAEAMAVLRWAGAHPIVGSFPQGAIIVFDADLRFVSAGGLGLAEVGLSREVLEGNTIFEVFPPEVVAVIEPLYRQALAGLESSMDVPYEGRTFLQRLGPLRDAVGGIVAGMGFTQDVTEMREAARALRESEERFRLCFDHGPTPMVLIALDGGAHQVNPAMCAFLGYPADQLIQLSAADITHPDDVAADSAAMARLIAGEQASYTLDKRFITGGGAVVWGTKSAAMVRGQDGAPLQIITQIQDITARKEHEQVLAEEHRRLRDAESIGRVGSWELDLLTDAVTWSAGLFELYGLDPDEFDGDYQSALNCIHPDDRAEIDAGVEACARTGEPFRGRYRITRGGDGALRWIDARGEAQYEGGRPVRISGAIADVTDQIAAQAFQQAVFAASPDIISVWDFASRSVLWTNRSIPEMLGYTDEDVEAMGGSIGEVVPAEDRVRSSAALTAARDAPGNEVVHVDYRMVAKDGTTRWFSQRTAPLNRGEDGRVTQLVGVLRDITAAMVAEQQLRHSALHDSLTGLPNRALLMDRLDSALARSERTHREVSVLFCDLDGFKQVNDSAGHAAGDQVLLEVAHRLTRALREGDTVARIGGDEFVIVIEPWNRTGGNDQHADPAADRALAARVAERVHVAVRQPITINEVEYGVSVSIGISHGALPPNGQHTTITAEEILRNADSAMYRAKTSGKDRSEVFERRIRTEVAERGRVGTV